MGDVQHRGKVFRVHLNSLAVILIPDGLLFPAKRSRFAGLSEIFQLVGSSISKVDVSMTRMSAILQVAWDIRSLEPSIVTIFGEPVQE